MNISFNQKNEIITTSRQIFCAATDKNKKNSGFTQNIINKSKSEIKEIKQNEEKRYNFIGAGMAVALLSGIGITLLNISDFFGVVKKKKKTYVAPHLTTKQCMSISHGGPKINYKEGPKAISNAWNNYIENIKTNRKNNNLIAQEYKKLFKNSETLLKKYEKRAKEIVLKNGHSW